MLRMLQHGGSGTCVDGLIGFWAELWKSIAGKTLAALLTPVLFTIIWIAIRRFYLAFNALWHAERALKAVARKKKDDLWTEGPGFWLRQPIRKPIRYADLQGTSIPILMIAATKGGVGKTSLAGSLAAHFAMRWSRQQHGMGEKPLRVLVIDQDFQGSFTTMTVDASTRYAQPSKANRLVSGEVGAAGLAGLAERISQTGMKEGLTIWTVPAYYDLAQAENRMLIEWLLPLSTNGLVSRLLTLLKIRSAELPKFGADVRYVLAEALLDANVQTSFDLVIVDSPPRLTTSHIQAMCASTHLLVPTILDGLSGDAVGRYLDQIATHKLGPPGDETAAICPHIRPIGVVCTMLPPNHGSLLGKINLLRQRISAARLKTDIVPEDCFIRQRTPYRDHAGERIAYAASSNDRAHEDLRTEVDHLGDYIAPLLGAAAKGWKRREA